MPDWLVELQGEEFDLKALTLLLCSPRLNVFREGSSYYLRYSSFALIDSPDEVRERAREVLQRASAAESIRCGSSLPITIGEVFRIEPDGTRRSFSSSVLGFKWNVRVAHAPVTEGDALAFARWLELAERDAKVDKVLRILVTRETNWVNLYNILDVVLSDVGGMIWQAGWAAERGQAFQTYRGQREHPGRRGPAWARANRATHQSNVSQGGRHPDSRHLVCLAGMEVK